MRQIQPLRAAFEEYSGSYTNMASDYSVTTLLMPPRIVQLERRYQDILDDRPIDIESMIKSFAGTAIHDKLERMLWRHISKNPAAGYLIEKRLWDRICGKKISGKFDVLLKDHLFDWKTTSVWKKVYADHSAWEQQLNIYAYMLGLCGVKVNKLTIIAWYSDFDKHKVNSDKYPATPIEAIPIKLWAEPAQKDFLEARIRLHDTAEALPDNELPECTKEDTWEKQTTFAIYKLTKAGEFGKRASRVVDSHGEANKWIKWKGLKSGEFKIIKRPGARTRCVEWCKVAEFCNQYKEYKKGK